MRYVKLIILVTMLFILLGGCGKESAKNEKNKTSEREGGTTPSIEGQNSNETAETSQKYKYYLGKKEGKKYNSGYSGKHDIGKKDPHYGWDLGSFYVTGFTSQTLDSDGQVVFLKTIGDEIVLNFELYQDIDKLNGKKDLSIARDKSGHDKYFDIKATDFGRGMLIVQHTNYQNKVEDPVLYADYLTGVSSDANTKAILLEEGDYKVSLDYRIRDDDLVFDDNYDYCIYFTFSIRNGNCMAFPFDLKTGDELLNCAYTENGFYLDLANSHYLDVYVKRETYADGADGLVEDVRFNGPAKEGYEYNTEGIYTITVKNPYINEPTTKKIYVGTNPILKAYVVNGISIAEIKEKINQGYTINEDGTFSEQPLATPSPISEEIIEKNQATPVQEGVHKEETNNEEEMNETPEEAIWIIIGVVFLGVLVWVGCFRKKKKAQSYGKKYRS